MFSHDIERAVLAAPRHRLAEISAVLWKAYSAGQVPEDEAQRLAEVIETKKAISKAPASLPRRVGSRPRSSASLERRRAWTASGWMPPAIASRFTTGEAAAIGVIVAEVAAHGRCELPIGVIAAKAGVCASTVRNALRTARKLALMDIEARRLRYDRSLPHVITIASRELLLWMRTRARVERTGGGYKTVLPTSNHLEIKFQKPTAVASKWDSRGGDGGWQGRAKTTFRFDRR